jgi:DNA replication protein DnaC
MAVDDLTEFHFFRQKNPKKLRLQWPKERKHWTLENWKNMPGLMNPGSCCFTLMGGPGYGENHMSTCIHHAACQHCRLVVMVWGEFSWHTMVLLKEVPQHLNST